MFCCHLDNHPAISPQKYFGPHSLSRLQPRKREAMERWRRTPFVSVPARIEQAQTTPSTQDDSALSMPLGSPIESNFKNQHLQCESQKRMVAAEPQVGCCSRLLANRPTRAAYGTAQSCGTHSVRCFAGNRRLGCFTSWHERAPNSSESRVLVAGRLHALFKPANSSTGKRHRAPTPGPCATPRKKGSLGTASHRGSAPPPSTNVAHSRGGGAMRATQT